MAASEVNGDPASWLSGQSECRLFSELDSRYRKGLREPLSWLVGNRQQAFHNASTAGLQQLRDKGRAGGMILFYN